MSTHSMWVRHVALQWARGGSVRAMEEGCSQHVYVTCHVRLAPLCTEALC